MGKDMVNRIESSYVDNSMFVAIAENSKNSQTMDILTGYTPKVGDLIATDESGKAVKYNHAMYGHATTPQEPIGLVTEIDGSFITVSDECTVKFAKIGVTVASGSEASFKKLMRTLNIRVI